MPKFCSRSVTWPVKNSLTAVERIQDLSIDKINEDAANSLNKDQERKVAYMGHVMRKKNIQRLTMENSRENQKTQTSRDPI